MQFRLLLEVRCIFYDSNKFLISFMLFMNFLQKIFFSLNLPFKITIIKAVVLDSVCVCVCVCVCGVCVPVCLLVRNLGEYFVLLLVEPIAGKNVSPSDKQLWRFLKNVLVAEKSQCKALSIGRHLEISLLLLLSAENTKTLTFLSLKFCFLGFTTVFS